MKVSCMGEEYIYPPTPLKPISSTLNRGSLKQVCTWCGVSQFGVSQFGGVRRKQVRKNVCFPVV
jgi:hypothetical protein